MPQDDWARAPQLLGQAPQAVMLPHPRTHAPQEEKPSHQEARAPQLEGQPHAPQLARVHA